MLMLQQKQSGTRHCLQCWWHVGNSYGTIYMYKWQINLRVLGAKNARIMFFKEKTQATQIHEKRNTKTLIFPCFSFYFCFPAEKGPRSFWHGPKKGKKNNNNILTFTEFHQTCLENTGQGIWSHGTGGEALVVKLRRTTSAWPCPLMLCGNFWAGPQKCARTTLNAA